MPTDASSAYWGMPSPTAAAWEPRVTQRGHHTWCQHHSVAVHESTQELQQRRLKPRCVLLGSHAAGAAPPGGIGDLPQPRSRDSHPTGPPCVPAQLPPCPPCQLLPQRAHPGSGSCCSAHTLGRTCASPCPGKTPSRLQGTQERGEPLPSTRWSPWGSQAVGTTLAQEGLHISHTAGNRSHSAAAPRDRKSVV